MAGWMDSWALSLSLSLSVSGEDPFFSASAAWPAAAVAVQRPLRLVGNVKRRKKARGAISPRSSPTVRTLTRCSGTEHGWLMYVCTYLDVEEIPALDGLADYAGLGQAGVLRLQRPQAADQLLVGVVPAHVDVDAVHPGARRLGRPRRRRSLLLPRLAVRDMRILHVTWIERCSARRFRGRQIATRVAEIERRLFRRR